MKCIVYLAFLWILSAAVGGTDMEEDPDAEYDESYEDEEGPMNNGTHVGDEEDESIIQTFRSTSLEIDSIHHEFNPVNFTQIENATSFQNMPIMLNMLMKINNKDTESMVFPRVSNASHIQKTRSTLMSAIQKNPVYTWRSVTTEDPIPKCAFQVGVDNEGGAIFVGRAKIWGHSVIANVRERIKKAFVPLWSEVHEKHDFEVLCINQGEGFWKDFRDKEVPRGAVIGGTETDEEKLYVGRVLYENMYLPCKIHPMRNMCFLAHNGQEHHIRTLFEILVIR